MKNFLFSSTVRQKAFSAVGKKLKSSKNENLPLGRELIQVDKMKQPPPDMHSSSDDESSSSGSTEKPSEKDLCDMSVNEFLENIDMDEEVLREDLSRALGGIEYMERDFYTMERCMKVTDTPTMLANQLLVSPGLFISLCGPRGSGKTVALTKIMFELLNNHQRTWTVQIDLSEMATKIEFSSPDQIFSFVMEESEHRMFHELLKKDPTKINILFDNIDALPKDKQLLVLKYVENLSEKGTGIVCTAIRESSQLQPGPLDQKIVVKIPELSSSEIELFIVKIWNKFSIQFETNFVRQCTELVMDVLQRLAVPAHFEILKMMGEVLIHDGESPGSVGIVLDNAEIMSMLENIVEGYHSS